MAAEAVADTDLAADTVVVHAVAAEAVAVEPQVHSDVQVAFRVEAVSRSGRRGTSTR